LATIVFMALSLLFSQLALASYVCPGQADPDAMARMMASGQPCEGMDSAQPVLCHQHATGSAQSFEAVKLPAASLPAIMQVIVLSVVALSEAGAVGAVAAKPEIRPPPDPLFLSTLRLRV
jgi:hypothetical protein